MKENRKTFYNQKFKAEEAAKFKEIFDKLKEKTTFIGKDYNLHKTG